MPQIALVIPAYNASRWIAETLTAVWMQERVPDQIIVVDDGSTDDTVATVNHWARNCDANLQLIEQRNQGAAAARNAGILATSAELIATLDADDVVLPDHLRVLESGFLGSRRIDFCFGDAESFQEERLCRPSYLQGSRICELPFDEYHNGLRVIRGSAYLGIVRGNPIPTSATLYRRQAAIDAGLYDASFPRCNDREFLLRMSRNRIFSYFPIVLARIRRHDDNLSHSRHRAKHLEQQIRACRKLLADRVSLQLGIDEIQATREAIAGAADNLCRAKANEGVVPYFRYLLQAMRDEQPPRAHVALKSFLRSCVNRRG